MLFKPSNFQTFKLIKKRRLIVVHLLENGFHQRFANESAAVFDGIAFAKPIQRPHFTFVEQDGDSIFARLFFH